MENQNPKKKSPLGRDDRSKGSFFKTRHERASEQQESQPSTPEQQAPPRPARRTAAPAEGDAPKRSYTKKPRPFDEDRPRTFDKKPYDKPERARPERKFEKSAGYDKERRPYAPAEGDAPKRSYTRKPRPFDEDRPRTFDKKPYDKPERARPERKFDKSAGPDGERRYDRPVAPARGRKFDKPDDGFRKDRKFDKPGEDFRKDRKFDKSESFHKERGGYERSERPARSRTGEKSAEPRVATRKYSKEERIERSAKYTQVINDMPLEMRLNRFMAMSGLCSRREADALIQEGKVTVNGEVVDQLGTKINTRTDQVRLGDEVLRGERKVYILLNKPKGYVTTVEDPHAEKTVIDLLKGRCKERVYPVGRLDKNTTGVLLLTNDGQLTKELTHPSYEKRKIYHVFLDKPCTEEDLAKLAEGIELEDGFIQADAVSFVDDNPREVGVELHSGRNRIVRRMFESLGYEVDKLDRVYFAGLTKMGLRRGFWRYLTSREVMSLKSGRYE